jgi:hypothetical protein
MRRIVHVCDMDVDEAFAAALALARALKRGEPSRFVAIDGEDRMNQQADVEAAFAELAEDRVDQEGHIVVEDVEHRRAARRTGRR